MAARYRDLPSVDELASHYMGPLPRPMVVSAARTAIDLARQATARDEEPDVEVLFEDLLRDIARDAVSRVINASGVLLHTNLGRASLSDRALERARIAGAGANNIEIDVTSGSRATRGRYVTRLMALLIGAEDTLVVNNNASALMLALATLASGRAVPVSRGELIEIGGSYRLPSIMDASGARLVEVGTTNRTRTGDYEVALQTHDVGCLLKVHPSNYRIEGYVTETGVEEMAALSTASDVPLVHDIGSGLLDSAAPWVPGWLSHEPAARQSLSAGADLVLFSGDKLLGGPQAGIIAGKSDLVARLRAHPMARALRVDAARHAALEATLETHLDGAVEELPLWRAALRSIDELRPLAEVLAEAADGIIESGESTVGAGSAPGAAIPTLLVRLVGGQGLYDRLLTHDPPILTRRDKGDLLIDVRCLAEDEHKTVAEALAVWP